MWQSLMTFLFRHSYRDLRGLNILHLHADMDLEIISYLGHFKLLYDDDDGDDDDDDAAI